MPSSKVSPLSVNSLIAVPLLRFILPSMMYWLPPTSTCKDELIKIIGNKCARTHIISSSFRYDGRDKATIFVPHVGFKSTGVKAVKNISIKFIRTCREFVNGGQ